MKNRLAESEKSLSAERTGHPKKSDLKWHENGKNMLENISCTFIWRLLPYMDEPAIWREKHIGTRHAGKHRQHLPACYRNKRKQKQRNADFQKKGKHTRMRYFPPVRDTAGNNAFSCVAIFHFVILTFYLSTSIFLLAHNINSTWKPIYAMLHLHVFPNKPPEKGHTHFAVSPNDKVNSLTVDNGTTWPEVYPPIKTGLLFCSPVFIGGRIYVFRFIKRSYVK